MTGSVPAPLAWAVRGLFAIALIFAMREARALLVPIALALVLTFVLAPAVRWLRRRGIPEVVGAGLLLLLLLGSLVPLAASLAEPAAQWREKAPTTLAQLFAQFDRMRAAIPGLGPPPTPDPPRPASTRGAARAAAAAASAPPPADPVKDRLASEGVALTGALIAVPMLIAMRSFFKRHRRLRRLARFLEGDYNAPPPLRALLRPRGRLAPRTARRGPAEARDKP